MNSVESVQLMKTICAVKMLSTEEHIEYFSKTLIPEITKKLNGKQIKNYEMKAVNELNGFMSAIYKAEIVSESAEGYERSE